MCLSQLPIVQAPNGRSSGQSMLLTFRTTEKNLIVIKKNTRLNPHKDKNGYPPPLSQTYRRFLNSMISSCQGNISQFSVSVLKIQNRRKRSSNKSTPRSFLFYPDFPNKMALKFFLLH